MNVLKVSKIWERGEISVGSMFFYGTTLLILIAIPVTVLILGNQTDRVTRASTNQVQFSDPPSITMDFPQESFKSTERITANVTSTNSNWNIIFFSTTFPSVSAPSQYLKTTIVSQGPYIGQAYYSSSVSGYFMAVTYQLQGIYGEFKSGDVMCSWDGGLYIYKQKDVNPVIALIDKNAQEGEWQRITSCMNSGVKRMEVTQ